MLSGPPSESPLHGDCNSKRHFGRSPLSNGKCSVRISHFGQASTRQYCISLRVLEYLRDLIQRLRTRIRHSSSRRAVAHSSNNTDKRSVFTQQAVMVRRDVVGPNALGRLFKHMLVTEWAAPDVIDDLYSRWLSILRELLRQPCMRARSLSTEFMIVPLI